MKIEEMVMVIYNQKGIEKNFLCSFEHFIKKYATDACDSYFEMAEVAAGLQETKQKDGSFFEMYYASNKTMYARFCGSLNELRLFIAGKLNDGMTNVFEEDFCDKECLDVLSRLGISTDRSMAIAKWPHYEKLESDLVQGEIYHNFNGSDYRLMERYSDRNMLFMDVNSGQFVVGVGVDYFVRYPQGEDRYSSLSETGIEWGSGVYLGNTPSTINFTMLRREYGKDKEILCLEDYRVSLKEQFSTYHALAKNEALVDSVREAATNAMYEEFGTGKPDTFTSKLNAGDYDKGFWGNQVQEKYRGR
jgi:hypothetical protein